MELWCQRWKGRGKRRAARAPVERAGAVVGSGGRWGDKDFKITTVSPAFTDVLTMFPSIFTQLVVMKHLPGVYSNTGGQA